MVLGADGLSLSFGAAVIIKEASIRIREGARMGLVGPNGGGKTTLLRILAGELSPNAGGVSIAKGVRVGFLSQHADIQSGLTVTEELSRVFEPLAAMEARLRELERGMGASQGDPEALDRLTGEYARLTDRFEEADGYGWPGRIKGTLTGLGFTAERAAQPSNALSGGEKTRLCLARLLLQSPELLLLDEPTNHLDLNAILWLEDALRKYRGAILAVSHDRYFLNAVCGEIAELSSGKLSVYRGNYDAFALQRRERLERQSKEYELQQAEIARQEAIIARYRAYNREKSIRAAESRERRLEKLERVEKPAAESKIRFRFEAARRSGDEALNLENLTKGFGGRTLFSDLTLRVRSGDRVAILGANGTGKSTILNLIAGRLTPDAGQVRVGASVDLGYYDQLQSGLHDGKTVMEDLWDDFPKLEPLEVRSALALFLFAGEDAFQRVGTLSGGERGRLALCKLMLRRDNLLLLDEPTNHLDMDSREVLESALSGYRGTLIMASHDRYFINRVATRVVELTAEGIAEYDGNYDAYMERKGRPREPQAEIPEKTQTERAREARKARLMEKSERDLKARIWQLEQYIVAAEERRMRLECDMADPYVYQSPERSQETARKYAENESDLEALYEEWGIAGELQ